MSVQDLIHNHADVAIAAVVAIGGTVALFARYGKTLLPRAGDKMKPGSNPARQALRPPIENLMRARGIKPTQDRDVA